MVTIAVGLRARGHLTLASPSRPQTPAPIEKGEGRRVLDEVKVQGLSRADRGGSRDDETFRPALGTALR